MEIKMNTLLAKVEQEQKNFANKVTSTIAKLRENKNFLGEKKTYSPREGYPEDASKTGNKMVNLTVSEVLADYIGTAAKCLNDVFAVEATNSKGAKTVELIVDGKSFGNLTALELMRLKSVLQAETTCNYVPTRNDSEVWTPSTDEDYSGREVYQTPMLSGVSRTTESEEYILKDPNVDPQHLPANYRPATTVKKKTVEIGDYTMQKFSGEWNKKQQDDAMRRKTALLTAVISALKEVNDIEAEKNRLDMNNVLNYIYFGK